MFSPLEQFDVVFYILQYFPLPFANLLASMVIFLIIFLFFSRFLKENLKLIPSLLQSIFELVYKFIFNLIKQQIGEGGYIYFPLLLTIFNFILIMNLFSLLPFGLAVTSHIIMIL